MVSKATIFLSEEKILFTWVEDLLAEVMKSLSTAAVFNSEEAESFTKVAVFHSEVADGLTKLKFLNAKATFIIDTFAYRQHTRNNIQ